MAGRAAAPLSKTLDFFQREVVARQVEKGIEQRGAVSAGEDEAIPIRPARVLWIVAQVADPDSVRHGSRAHRQARVTGVGLLHRVRREKSQCVDGTLLEIVVRHG